MISDCVLNTVLRHGEFRGMLNFYLENRNIIANFVAEDFGGSSVGFLRKL